MIPSGRWFPTNIPERADWFANFTAQFIIVAASLGLSSKIAQLEKDNSVMQFIASAFTQVDAFDEAMRQYRLIITEKPVGSPTPAIPAVPAFVLPDPVETGIFQRLIELRTQIMAADAYTDEIGALLGILPKQKQQVAPANVKLDLTVHTAETGYVYTVVASKRGEADSWDVSILRKGANNWEKVGTFTGKSVDLTFIPTTAGEPEQFQCRIQGRKNNQNYGQPSDIVNVTAKP